MDFVDDEHLGPRLKRAVAGGVDHLTHIVHAGAAGGVHLDHVRVAVGQDRDAVRANAARVRGRATLTIRANAIEGARNNPRRRGLSHAAHAGQHPSMGNAVERERIAQRAYHHVLAD